MTSPRPSDQRYVLRFECLTVLKSLPGADSERAAPSSLHGGGLPSSVVAQEGGDLALVEVQGQAVHSHLHAISVHLHQALNGHPQLQVAGLLLHAD